MASSERCTMCNKSDAKLCNKCKSARYCSRDCQLKDWNTHKLLCSDFAKFDITERPDFGYIRAILFPVDEVKPRFVWVNPHWFARADDEHRDKHIRTYLGEDSSPGATPVHYNEEQKRHIDVSLDVCYREDFQHDGSKQNRSLNPIFATKFGQFLDWKGPIVVHRQSRCGDMDMNDFHNAVDFFLNYYWRPTPGAVKAVRINCIGDQEMGAGRPVFEPMEIAPYDTFFTPAMDMLKSKSDVAGLINFPIITSRLPHDPKWKKKQREFSQKATVNQHSAFFHLSGDPDNRYGPADVKVSWGYVEQALQAEVGSMFVVREAMKPLHLWHVEAFSKYISEEIVPMFRCYYEGKGAGGGESDKIRKTKVMSRVSEASWKTFWDKFITDKRKTGPMEKVVFPNAI